MAALSSSDRAQQEDAELLKKLVSEPGWAIYQSKCIDATIARLQDIILNYDRTKLPTDPVTETAICRAARLLLKALVILRDSPYTEIDIASSITREFGSWELSRMEEIENA